MNFHESEEGGRENEGRRERGREKEKRGREQASEREREREIVLYKDKLLDDFIPPVLFIFLLYINCVEMIGESWACWIFFGAYYEL